MSDQTIPPDLAAAIAERRSDEEYVARRDRHVEKNRAVLDRLAALDDSANIFRNHSDAGVIAALKGWARDQREREAWRDGDEQTYRYRASLLEEASRRLTERAVDQPAGETP